MGVRGVGINLGRGGVFYVGKTRIEISKVSPTGARVWFRILVDDSMRVRILKNTASSPEHPHNIELASQRHVRTLQKVEE